MTQSNSQIVTSLGDLDKLIELCKKHGLTSIQVDGIAFHIAATPVPTAEPEAKLQERDPDINAIAYNTYRTS